VDHRGDVLLHVPLDDLFDPSVELGVRRRVASLPHVQPAQLEELPALDFQASAISR